jgi:hypothetical protein
LKAKGAYVLFCLGLSVKEQSMPSTKEPTHCLAPFCFFAASPRRRVAASLLLMVAAVFARKAQAADVVELRDGATVVGEIVSGAEAAAPELVMDLAPRFSSAPVRPW